MNLLLHLPEDIMPEGECKKMYNTKEWFQLMKLQFTNWGSFFLRSRTLFQKLTSVSFPIWAQWEKIWRRKWNNNNERFLTVIETAE